MPNPYGRMSEGGKIEIKIDFGTEMWRYDARAAGLGWVGATMIGGSWLSREMIGFIYKVGDQGTVYGRYWVSQVQGEFGGS